MATIAEQAQAHANQAAPGTGVMTNDYVRELIATAFIAGNGLGK